VRSAPIFRPQNVPPLAGTAVGWQGIRPTPTARAIRVHAPLKEVNRKLYFCQNSIAPTANPHPTGCAYYAGGHLCCIVIPERLEEIPNDLKYPRGEGYNSSSMLETEPDGKIGLIEPMAGQRDARAMIWAALRLVKGPLSRVRGSQIAVFLMCYAQSEPQSVRGLARRLGIARPNVSLAMRRLESLALLKRSIDPTDRRGVVAEQTQKGLALVERRPHSRSRRRGASQSNAPPPLP
jgi:MarR family